MASGALLGRASNINLQHQYHLSAGPSAPYPNHAHAMRLITTAPHPQARPCAPVLHLVAAPPHSPPCRPRTGCQLTQRDASMTEPWHPPTPTHSAPEPLCVIPSATEPLCLTPTTPPTPTCISITEGAWRWLCAPQASPPFTGYGGVGRLALGHVFQGLGSASVCVCSHS